MEGTVATEVSNIPCELPHDDEAYFEFQLPGDDYPGGKIVAVQAEETCRSGFEKFVGIAYEDSMLDHYQHTPTEASWYEFDDRMVTGLVYDPDAQTIGSFAGRAR